MKTAVSVPDDVFQAADRLAAERGVSRSEVYTEALRRYLQAEAGQDEVTQSLNEVYGDPAVHDEQRQFARASSDAARSVIEGGDWEW